MTLQASGPISAADVNVELGRASNAPFDMNDAAVRALAGVPTGSYGFDSFYGKSSAAPFSVSATPPSIYQQGTTTTIFTDDGALATVTGGVGPFTYSWTFSGQSGAAPVIASSPTASSTVFRAQLPFSGNFASATAACTVTDTSNAQQLQTNEVFVIIERVRGDGNG